MTEEVFEILRWKGSTAQIGKEKTEKEHEALYNVLYFGYRPEDNPQNPPETSPAPKENRSLAA